MFNPFRSKRKTSAKIPNTKLTYSRPKPRFRNLITKKALYEWSRNKHLVNQIRKGSSALGRFYAKQIMSAMKPRTYNKPLYRGLWYTFVPGKQPMSSFTKNFTVANSYSNGNGNIVILNNPKNVPVVNFNNYKSEFPGEAEVIIAPGTYKILKRNGRFVHVEYFLTQ